MIIAVEVKSKNKWVSGGKNDEQAKASHRFWLGEGAGLRISGSPAYVRGHGKICSPHAVFCSRLLVLTFRLGQCFGSVSAPDFAFFPNVYAGCFGCFGSNVGELRFEDCWL